MSGLIINVHFTSMSYNDRGLNSNIITIVELNEARKFIKDEEVNKILQEAITFIRDHYITLARYNSHVVIAMNYFDRQDLVYTTALPIVYMKNIEASIMIMAEQLQNIVLLNYGVPKEPTDYRLPKKEIVPEAPTSPYIKKEEESKVKKFNL